MTREQHKKLVKYEGIFRTAINGNYYRAMTSAFAKDLLDVAKELNVYVNPSCGQCMLRAIQTLGRLYFEYQEEPEIEFPLDAPKEEDNKPIKQEKKVKESAPKNKKK